MVEVIQSRIYNAGEARGVGILIAAGFLSLTSVLLLLTIMAVSAYRTRASPDDHIFIRTHVAAYFVSLLLSDLTQAVGSIINIAWVTNGGVWFGGLCTAQAAIKQTGNVGTALWSMVIAIHTFALLFYRAKIPDWVCYVVLVFVWLLLGLILSLGPAVLAKPEKGPFYGISGLWCWMTIGYPVEKYALEYGIEFFSAGVAFVLYALVFLRLRGNIAVNGLRFHFQRRVVVKGYSSRQYNAMTDPSQNTHVMKVARQMMWYPIAYTILVVPIAAARFASFSGKPVPYQVTIFAATIFLLSGFVNAVLFTSTRRVVPASTIFPKFIRDRFGISTGTGMNTNTHQRSLTGTGTVMSRVSKAFPPNNYGTGPFGGIGISIEKAVAYDDDYPPSPPDGNGSFPMSQRTHKPFEIPYSSQYLGPNGLNSPTNQGRKVMWGDDASGSTKMEGGSTDGRKRSGSSGSGYSAESGRPGDLDGVGHLAQQYPSPPRQHQHLSPLATLPVQPMSYQPPQSYSQSQSYSQPDSQSPTSYTNSRTRGGREYAAAYGYASQDSTHFRE